MTKTLEQAKADYLEAAKSKPLKSYAVRDRNGAVCASSNTLFPFCYPDAEDLAWAKAQGHQTYEDVGHEWVTAWKQEGDEYLSAKGGYYSYESLPEQSDDVVSELWAAEMKSERNSRLDDCDDYATLSDITVRREARGKRTPLTDEEREEIKTYRQALRDLPDQPGFPFVDFPAVPECIAFEVEEKAEMREKTKEDWQ